MSHENLLFFCVRVYTLKEEVAVAMAAVAVAMAAVAVAVTAVVVVAEVAVELHCT